jgi:hypothetical protein
MLVNTGRLGRPLICLEVVDVMKKRIICLLLCCLSWAGTAGARDLYVAAGAGGNGARATPFSHLWQAFLNLQPSDVIHVAEGTYRGFLGSGNFTVPASGCTLLGGYSRDFSRRDPFRLHTVLEQDPAYRGQDRNSPILRLGEARAGASGITVDGFVLDGRTKSAYSDTGQIILARSNLFPLLEVNAADVKIRNCIVINHSWKGIHGVWAGTNNEISNCFIINTYYAAFTSDGSKPGATVRFANNTVAFIWQRYSSRGAVQIGENLQALVEHNVFMYVQCPAVDNINPETVLRRNVFFQCQEGFYQGRSKTTHALAWRPEDLHTMEEYPELFRLKSAAGNTVQDTGIRPDPEYFRSFSDVFAQDTEKLDMDKLNDLRRQMGYTLDAPPPPADRDITGRSYTLSAVVPALVYKGGEGAQPLPISLTTKDR